LHVAWQFPSVRNHAVAYRSSPDGRAWGRVQDLSPPQGTIDSLHLAAAPTGGGFAVWTGRRGIEAASLAGARPDRRPTLGPLNASPRSFRIGFSPPDLSGGRGRPGTTFTFTVSEPASTRISFARLRGSRSTRVPYAVELTAQTAGRQRVHFEGPIDGLGHRLAPGRYRATVVVFDDFGQQSAARSVVITVRR
jgi:hypothetical protein